jgi:hypothetical protein
MKVEVPLFSMYMFAAMDTSVEGNSKERCAVVGLLGSVLISTNFLHPPATKEIINIVMYVYLIIII